MPSDTGTTGLHDAWVTRVLGVAMPPRGPDAAATPRTTGRAPGAVSFAKLQLSWRDAQAKVKADLAGFAGTLLAHPAVKADPRYDQVRQVADGFADLVPSFGERLEDALNAIINAGRVTPELGRESAAAIADYRGALARVPELLKLEAFARTHLGVDVPAHAELDRTLGALDASLARAGSGAAAGA